MRPLFRLLLFLAVVLGKAAPPLEAELYPAYNRMYSNVNGSYHPGWELWAEAKVGYTVDFAADRLFLHPAPGIGFGVFQTNPPPNFHDEIESPIFVPQLLVGVRF